MAKKYFTYILTNYTNSVLYTGVTNDLVGRIFQHKSKAAPGFTTRYNVTKLVYYESFDSAYSAITREKQIKAGSRKRKVQLVESMNPLWKEVVVSA